MNKLIQKQNEMENKFKFEKLSYLFFIGENQKKIKELTKKLSMESIDKIPKNELNKVNYRDFSNDYEYISFLHLNNTNLYSANLELNNESLTKKLCDIYFRAYYIFGDLDIYEL